MKCAVHTEVDATGFCRNCGKALCADCTRDVRGILYCEECLAQMVAKPQPIDAGSSPALAAILGLIPGLGAVYNGEYMKGLVHVIIFGSLIALAESGGAAGPLFGIMTAVFYLYMPIEAYRTAKAKMLGQKPESLIPALDSDQPIGAYILIGLGVIFLLDNLVPGFNPWRMIGKFWPIILILLGALLLRNRMQAGKKQSTEPQP
jgi:hypothetical protein